MKDPLYFVFRKDEILVREDVSRPAWPTEAELALEGAELHDIGAHEGARCHALAIDLPPPPGFTFVGLRALFARVGEAEWHLAGRALQVLEWDRTSRFCGACGAPTEPVPNERARRCPACRLVVYPRIAPAIIVLIERGDEAVLAKPGRLPTIYSTLAGFVEPGETLEQTLAREVEEEVGLTVRDPRYFGSQPWPFPHSLMIGFHATYAGGELRADGQEILDARWFRFDALPNIPPRISIARALIDDWVARRAKKSAT